jgi:transcriptional regulator with XRE-family HTH domain
MRTRLTWAHDKRIGDAIRRVRQEANLTQRQLADRLGVAHTRIARVEIGRQRIALDEFIVWCEAIGINAADVLRTILHQEE